MQENTPASIPEPIGDREIFEIVGGWQ